MPGRPAVWRRALAGGALWLACAVGANFALAQTNRTWNGSAGSDWFNPANWTPTGVPGANDTVNFNSGAINLTAPVTIGGQFNWSGGSLAGNPLVIAANGVLNLIGGSVSLSAPLTNAGTINWSNSASWTIYNNNSPSYSGAIYNLPGALLNIQSDQGMNGVWGYASFNNAGTVRKGANGGTTTFNLALTNSGAVVAANGAINFNSGGDLDGTFTAATGASINFNGGAFSYLTPPTVSGPGLVQLTGGSLVLVSNTIPNLQLAGGTVTLGTNFQGGAITNLTSGASLSGNYTVSGRFSCAGGSSGNLEVAGGALLNWSGGNINGGLTLAGGATANWSGGGAYGPVSIAANAVLNLIGGGVTLSAPLTNAGTINWSNSASWTIYNNNSPSYSGALYNLPGALLNIQSDQGMNGAWGYAFFNNAGTVSKGANAGTTTFNLAFTNSGAVIAANGAINFNSGGDLDGTFAAATGASINFNGGAFGYLTPPTVSGPGLVQLTGGSLVLVSNTIPNLQLAGGTVTLGTNFQGGTITNLTSGASLSGNYTVSGRFSCAGGSSGNLEVAGGALLNWSGGNINGGLTLAGGGTANWSGGGAYGPVSIATNAVLNLVGGGVVLCAPLTNAGTINWSNSASWTIYNNNSPSYSGALYNLPGALLNIQSDQGMNGAWGYAFFNNAGTVSKGANAGTTTFNLAFTNSGLVTVLAGALNFNGGGLLQGTFDAASGTAINFNSGSFGYLTAPTLNGPGLFQLTGGSLALLDNVVPNLALVGGTVTVGTNFQGGTITNLTSGATLNGSFTVSGLFNCSGGVSGNVLVADGATLNFSGGTISGNLTLAGGAQVNWGGGNVSGALLVPGGALLNWSGGNAYGPVSIATNGVLNLVGGGVALCAPLTNAGTINWSNSASWTIYNNNSPSYSGALYNLPGALLNIQSDQGMNGAWGYAFFNNAGTVSKGANAGTTTFNLAFTNSGLVTVLEGAINFNGGGQLQGTFDAVSGTAINFNGGSFGFLTAPTLNGPGLFQLTGGSLALLNDLVPNLALAGGTVTGLGTNFQGGTITNLTSGATLNGSFTVSGLFNCGGGVSGNVLVADGATLNFSGGTISGNLTVAGGALVNWSGGTVSGNLTLAAGALVNWSGGTASGSVEVPGGALLNWSGGSAYGPVSIATNGVLNLIGGGVALCAPLTNAGTINWSNSASWTIYNNNSPSYSGALYNLPGALLNIQSDQGMNGAWGYAFFNNAGTVSKGANAGTTTFNLAFTNSGLVTVLAGALTFNGGGPLQGTYAAASGTAISFNGGSFSYVTLPALNGPGLFQLTGGSLALLDNVVPNLALVGGTVTLATNFQGGAITNLTSGATLNGSFTVSGLFNGSGGVSGNVLVADGATLNFSGGTISGNLTLADGAQVNWGGGNVSGALLVPGGALLNWSGGNAYGPVSIATNGVLNLIGGGVALCAPLTNAGTINWSNSASWTVYNNNSPSYSGALYNLPGALLNIQSDQGMNGAWGYAFFNNAGTVSKGANRGTTTFNLAFTNLNLIDVESGVVNFNGLFAQPGGAWTFGLDGPGNYGQIRFSGNVALAGALNVNLNSGYLPPVNTSFALVADSSQSGSFASVNLPADGLYWQLQYTANAVNLLVTNYLGPAVAITSPLSGAAFTASTDIALTATATDSNAPIAKVEFFQGANKLGEAPNSPYNVTWRNVSPGFYWLTAKATDALGASATSSPVNINVYSSVNPSTNFFWVGGLSSDWFTPGNWNPAGVPGLYDVANITNGGAVALSSGTTISSLNLSSGTLKGSGHLTVTTAFNWSAGAVGCPLTLASSAVLNLNGSGTAYLEGALTNAGTVNWSSGSLDVYACSSPAGPIVNLAGGVWNIQCDQNLHEDCSSTNAYFQNAGLLQKSVTAGTTSFSIPIYNSGQVTALSGTLNFNGGGTIAGTFNASSGTAIDFSGGNFSSSTASLNGPGLIQLNGGSLTLLDSVIPDLALTGGTVALAAGFQGGAITNLTLSGSTLAGSNAVTGTLNWMGGSIAGPLTIAGGALVNWSGGSADGPVSINANGVLNLVGAGSVTLYAPLTNAGTINWSNSVTWHVYNNNASDSGAIYNLSGALLNIQSDQGMNGESVNPFFNNAGTISKGANTGATTFNLAFTNRGLVTALSGTINFKGGGMIAGTFNASSGAAIDFSAGTFASAAATLNGPGLIQLNGGSLTLLNNLIPNLALTGGTVVLATNFQGGTITNLTLSGSTLAGANAVTGTLNCLGGAIAGPLTIATNGVLILGGTGTLYLEGALTNAGTVSWLSGDVQVYNSPSPGTVYPVVNLARGLWDIRCDQSLYPHWGGYTNAYFQNAGTVQKSAATGTTYISIPFYNSSVLAPQSGVINFNANPAYAQTGATLDFDVRSLSSAGHVAIAGNVNFDGTLQVDAANGYVPSPGDVLSLVSYGSEGSPFQSLSLPLLGAGQAWQLSYTPNALLLQVVPSAAFSEQISGSVTDTHGQGVTNISVFAYTTNGIALYVSGRTDAGGNYALAVTNGNWTVGLQGLPARGYNLVPDQLAAVSNGNQTVNFVLQPFSGQTFTITTTVNPAGAGTAVGGGTFPAGGTVTLSATPLTNTLPYLFASWTENGLFESAASSYSFTATRDRQLTANFTLPIYIVSAANVPAGAGTVTGAGSYFYGTTNVLTAYPNLGYNFAYWTYWSSNVFSTFTQGGQLNNEYPFSFPCVLEQGETLDFIVSSVNGDYSYLSSGLKATITYATNGGGQAVYDALADFSTNANPAGVWSYGWSTDAGGHFQFMTNSFGFSSQADLGWWNGLSLPNSAVIDKDFSGSSFQQGTVVLDTDTLHVDPENEAAIVRFTAPNSGTFQVSGLFRLQDTGTHPHNFTITTGNNLLSTSPVVTVVVYGNLFLVAHYGEANTTHTVTTATQPPGLAVVAGAGTYTNGQTASFSAPLFVTNSPDIYTFQQFTLSNTLASSANSFNKTFSTLDPTNLQYVAVYGAQSILPLLTNVSANYAPLVPATTNLVLRLQFDRSMRTNLAPLVVLTNSAAATQPVVAANGAWSATVLNHDTYSTPPITIAPGMDGTMQLYVSGAQDTNGGTLALTNAAQFTVLATPPPNPVLTQVSSNSSSVTVGWSSYHAPADLAGFRVYIQATNYSSVAGLSVPDRPKLRRAKLPIHRPVARHSLLRCRAGGGCRRQQPLHAHPAGNHSAQFPAPGGRHHGLGGRGVVRPCFLEWLQHGGPARLRRLLCLLPANQLHLRGRPDAAGHLGTVAIVIPGQRSGPHQNELFRRGRIQRGQQLLPQRPHRRLDRSLRGHH